MPVDPLNQVAQAQALFEKGPLAAVAAFFALSFFFALLLLLRSKDKHLLAQERMQKTHAEELNKLYAEQRGFVIKLELAVHGLLDMMDDLRVIAFEAQRTRQVRRIKKGSSPEIPPEEGGT